MPRQKGGPLPVHNGVEGRIEMNENALTTTEVLERVVARTQALSALLVTVEGVCVAEAGQTDVLNTSAMAALVAGVVSATQELARLVDEPQFSVLLQQGERRHIHISLVGDGDMMVIVFSDEQRMGLIRYEARKAAQMLAETKHEEADAEAERAREEISIPDFKEHALSIIDRIFADS